MAGLFENYRSAHHPDEDVRLPLAGAYLRGEVDDAVAESTLRRRDRLLWLEMESSSLSGILIEPLARACPSKKFILTIRDVYSWCDSWIDHNINFPPDNSSRWGALDRIRLRIKDFQPAKFDSPFIDRGLPPLACYFQLWAHHNRRILETVPSSRLLVIETHQITPKIPEIAAWAGVPVETLRIDRQWLFSTPEKHHALATLDERYVQETADRFCGSLMHANFPETSWERRAVDDDLAPAGSDDGRS